jgi:hypothetical protein
MDDRWEGLVHLAYGPHILHKNRVFDMTCKDVRDPALSWCYAGLSDPEFEFSEGYGSRILSAVRGEDGTSSPLGDLREILGG